MFNTNRFPTIYTYFFVFSLEFLVCFCLQQSLFNRIWFECGRETKGRLDFVRWICFVPWRFTYISFDAFPQPHFESFAIHSRRNHSLNTGSFSAPKTKKWSRVVHYSQISVGFPEKGSFIYLFINVIYSRRIVFYEWNLILDAWMKNYPFIAYK